MFDTKSSNRCYWTNWIIQGLIHHGVSCISAELEFHLIFSSMRNDSFTRNHHHQKSSKLLFLLIISFEHSTSYSRTSFDFLENHEFCCVLLYFLCGFVLKSIILLFRWSLRIDRYNVKEKLRYDCLYEKKYRQFLKVEHEQHKIV